MRPTPPTAKLEDLARTLTSAPDVDLKDFAATPSRSPVRAAPRRAAGRAHRRYRTRDRSERDASHAARSIPVEPRFARRAGAVGRDRAGIRRELQARAVRGSDQVASGLYERAAHLRHRSAVLCHLQHLVGEFG